MVGTSYIPFPPWALFFCYVPLWVYVVEGTPSLRRVFGQGWLAQFVLSLIGFFWIYHVSREFGYLPLPLAALALILFAALVHLHIPVSLVIVHVLRGRWRWSKGVTYLYLALSLWALETFWPMIFPWNLAYSLIWARIPAFQLADGIGFEGLSLLILLSQAGLAYSISLSLGNKEGEGRRQWRQWLQLPTWVGLLVVALFWVVLSVTGSWRGELFAKRSYSTLKVGLVQGNVSNSEKVEAEKQGYHVPDMIQKYFDMSLKLRDLRPDVQLFIWPEAAIPEFLDEHNRYRKHTRLFYDRLPVLQRPIILGAFSSDPMERFPRRDFNALFAFSKEGLMVSPPYQKTKLLIFGEYTPLAHVFPILSKYNPAGSGFSAGVGPQIFLLDGWKIGLQICYESLFPSFSNQVARWRADMIVNVTNDSWFGPYGEPYQHLYMTLARAIETRLTLIRVTNSGFSSVIDGAGRIYTRSPLFEDWSEVVTVRLYHQDQPTFFVRYREIMILMVMLLILIGLWFLRYLNMRNQERVHD
ncbi:MAG: apolipoprotein N-acyltransferase [Bdellovibrionaceae bacterium]|nr:apolipoprotein N-acyltransferase [Pseudobdellovibrionaceae bacterium]MDW8190991.1 apolipoprotein N-acyltransferase [Pseudobdellovibrionaceae bacterium]